MAGLSERIYRYSPETLQDVMASIQGANFRFRKLDLRLVRKHLARLLESETWSVEQLRELQLKRLKQTVANAITHVPFYQRAVNEWGINLSNLKAPDDIKIFPIISKADVRGQEREFLSKAISRGPLWIGNTSGTTGTPLRTFTTREAFSERTAYLGRLRIWAGIEDPVLPRRAQFTGRDIVTARHPTRYWRHNFPGNSLLLSTSHLSPKTASTYAHILCDYQPELIDGYPSAFLILSKLALAEGLDLPRPKAIICTAETLSPEARETIQRAFGAPVFNQYAASEPSCFAGTCEHGSLHVSPEYGIFELVDEHGHDVPPGTPGHVIVTSFLNPAMPLIRYRVGDLAVWANEQRCACGRNFPILARVDGRADDILYVPDRGYLGRLDPVFKGLTGIIESQIVQIELNRIEVRLVPDRSFSPAVEAALIERLRAKVGEHVQLSVLVVPAIARGANGKFRSVLSLVRDQYPHSI